MKGPAVSRIRLAAVAAAVALLPSTGTQIQNGFLAVLSAIGVVPIVPRSANGPARRTRPLGG